jgi:hypothetical protein
MVEEVRKLNFEACEPTLLLCRRSVPSGQYVLQTL